MSLHPRGLAPRIVNLAQWRAHLLERLQRQVELSADAVLEDLLTELRGYPLPPVRGHPGRIAAHEDAGVFVPLQLSAGDAVLSFISTTTVFGTPVDVTLDEIALECFFPADADTTDHLRRLAEGSDAASVAP